jgi:hypothetical protein
LGFMISFDPDPGRSTLVPALHRLLADKAALPSCPCGPGPAGPTLNDYLSIRRNASKPREILQ